MGLISASVGGSDYLLGPKFHRNQFSIVQSEQKMPMLARDIGTDIETTGHSENITASDGHRLNRSITGLCDMSIINGLEGLSVDKVVPTARGE